MTQAPRASLWSKWVPANSIGELIGLGATFAIGAGLFAGLVQASGTAAALVSAGLGGWNAAKHFGGRVGNC